MDMNLLELRLQKLENRVQEIEKELVKKNNTSEIADQMEQLETQIQDLKKDYTTLYEYIKKYM